MNAPAFSAEPKPCHAQKEDREKAHSPPDGAAALAAYAGTTTTNLAHMLKAFHEGGIIRALTPRRFEILDEARLAAALPEN